MRAPRLLRKGRGRGGEKSNFFCNPSVTRGPGMPLSHLSFFIGHSSFEQTVAVCRSQSIYPVVVRLQRKRIPVSPMGVNLKGYPDFVVLSGHNPANYVVRSSTRPLPKNPVAITVD